MATCGKISSTIPHNGTPSTMEPPKVKQECGEPLPLPGSSKLSQSKEVFIDLTIESLKDSIAETIIDLTQDEDLPTIDLTKKVVKTKEWWTNRKNSLKKLKDDGCYTNDGLELCWPALRKSKRFKKPIKTCQIPKLKPANYDKFIGEKIIGMKKGELPFTLEQVLQIKPTLDSFTNRVYHIVDKGNVCEDRQKAAYDTLAHPVFHQILTIVPKYINSKGFLNVPQNLIPDLELLQLSLLTLHRAKQYFHYFKSKLLRMELSFSTQCNAGQFYQHLKSNPKKKILFHNRLDNDLKNIDIMIMVVEAFVEKLRKRLSCGRTHDEPSCRKERETMNATASLRVKKEDTDDQALINRNLESESDGLSIMAIKREQIESLNSCEEEQMNYGEKQAIVKCKLESESVKFNNMTIKNERMESLNSGEDEQMGLEGEQAFVKCKVESKSAIISDNDNQQMEHFNSQEEEGKNYESEWSDPVLDLNSPLSGSRVGARFHQNTVEQDVAEDIWQRRLGIEQQSIDIHIHCRHATNSDKPSTDSQKTSPGSEGKSTSKKNAKKRVLETVATSRAKRGCPRSPVSSNMRAISECD